MQRFYKVIDLFKQWIKNIVKMEKSKRCSLSLSLFLSLCLCILHMLHCYSRQSDATALMYRQRLVCMYLIISDAALKNTPGALSIMKIQNLGLGY